ncbi:amidohydrolase family protein [Kitasatospora sp. NPDC002227]|uniref:amidohydrolase family protein n=1 Tax=Kitasatospora sp. NPDC002227 TaxID=3154773 RepID=UPI0033263A10
MGREVLDGRRHRSQRPGDAILLGPGCASQLAWEYYELEEAVFSAVWRCWRMDIHAYGDRGGRSPARPVRARAAPHLRPALRCPGDGARRARGPGPAPPGRPPGHPGHIQQPLLHDAAAIQTEYWGGERVTALLATRAWLDAGSDISAGSDYPVGSYGAAHFLHGLTTRSTVAGVLGPGQVTTRAEAVHLHTAAAARLTTEAHLRGLLTPGRLADLTAWPENPFTSPALDALLPSHTLLGDTMVHGPEVE